MALFADFFEETAGRKLTERERVELDAAFRRSQEREEVESCDR